MPLLEVNDLVVDFGRHRRVAVDHVSWSLDAGERLGLIGESGSGKSVTALAIMGLLPGNAHVSGSVRWRGKELVGARTVPCRPFGVAVLEWFSRNL
ncbi:oligopeptide/dipeptide ABC transporter [Cutibacterium acnes JCM 18920]|nr:oligopeptide/dipeptide ABC transporter [Cutibacterium acnes JCM 18920]